MCVSAKNTAVCCLTARKSPRNSSLPLGLAIHILRKMPTKSDESSVEWPWFLIAARPRGGIEHYGNWVCRPTTSLRERCEHTTSTLFVSYCISDSAYSKSYKAKGSTCVSIFDQWLLWSGSRPAVQT